jgi:hypothetical protein
MNGISLFEKYQLEVAEDTKIDDFNLKEKQMELPTIKHKWVARLIVQKNEVSRLRSARAIALEKIKTKVRETSVVTLSERAVSMQAEKSDIINKIDDLINQNNNLVLYLEKVEKILSQTTFDVKNVIDIRKLEMT